MGASSDNAVVLRIRSERWRRSGFYIFFQHLPVALCDEGRSHAFTPRYTDAKGLQREQAKSADGSNTSGTGRNDVSHGTAARHNWGGMWFRSRRTPMSCRLLMEGRK
ncbi:unnamed protein product [Gadus morhua 'NCC']